MDDSFARKERLGLGEHLTQEDIGAYWSRSILPDRLRWAADHLIACAGCRAGVFRTPQAIEALRRLEVNLTPDVHLDYETLTGLLDEALSFEEANRAVEHLGECARCAGDLEAIRQVSDPAPALHSSPDLRPADSRPRTFRHSNWALAASLAAAVLIGVQLGRAPAGRNTPQPGASGLAETRRLLDELSHQLQRAEKLGQDLAAAVTTAKQRQATPDLKPAPSSTQGAGREPILTAGVPASVRDALRSGVLRFPVTLTSLLLPGETVRGPNGETERIEDHFPSRTLVDDVRPLFSWKAGTGAWSYDVVVVAATGSGEQIRSGPIRGASWRPPVSLKRGSTYTWQVTGISPEGRVFVTPAPKPRFSVLDDAGHRALANERSRYAAAPEVLGVLLAERGVLHEAQSQLEKYARSHPDSLAAKQLLTRVRHALLPPSVPRDEISPSPPGLGLPAVGVDSSGNRYTSMVEAYSRLRSGRGLTSPDGWAYRYGPDEAGRAQNFKNGQARILTRSGPEGAPAYYLEGAILNKYEEVKNRQGRGGPYGALGWVTSDEQEAPPSRNDSNARFQRFERGAIYHWLSGRWKGYTFEVHDDPESGLFIHRKYEELGGCAGNRHPDPDLQYSLGLPDHDIAPAATNPLTGQTGILGRFEGAQIYGVRGRGAFVVAGKIHEKFERLGGTDDPIGFPRADRTKTGPSGARTGAEGVAQEFEGGTLFWRRQKTVWDGDAYLVDGAMLKAYQALGGVGGDLGFPIADMALVTSSFATQGQRQSFEGGMLFNSRFGAFVVPGPVAAIYEAKYGFPLGKRQPDGRQLFEGGTLTPVTP